MRELCDSINGREQAEKGDIRGCRDRKKQISYDIFRQSSGGRVSLPGDARSEKPGTDRMGQELLGRHRRDGSPGNPEEIRRMVVMIADSRYIEIEDVRVREIPMETESGFRIRE